MKNKIITLDKMNNINNINMNNNNNINMKIKYE